MVLMLREGVHGETAAGNLSKVCVEVVRLQSVCFQITLEDVHVLRAN